MKPEVCKTCPHHIMLTENLLKCHLVTVPHPERFAPENAASYYPCSAVPLSVCSRVRLEFDRSGQEPPQLRVSFHYCGQNSYWMVREVK